MRCAQRSNLLLNFQDEVAYRLKIPANLELVRRDSKLHSLVELML